MRERDSVMARVARMVVLAVAALLPSCGDIGLPVVGWDAGPGCNTNKDCVGEAGRPVCETMSRRCVQCTVAMDRACTVGQFCDETAFVCRPGCRNDTDCVNTPATPRCLTTARPPACVQCVTDTHCPTGQRCANNMCIDCVTDADCGPGRVCLMGRCQTGCNPAMPACPSGNMCCPQMSTNICIDTQTSAANCGQCGRACPSGPNSMASCTGGVCGIICMPATEFGNCDMIASNGCETMIRTDVNHCGGCGMACAMRMNATAACAMGACSYTCNMNFGDCNSDLMSAAGNGCETDLRTTVAHCGGCAMACSNNNGTPACAGGMCNIMCNRGFDDCDRNARTNGCEVNLNTDDMNCGMCGNVCRGGAACVNGVCHRFPSRNPTGPLSPPAGSPPVVLDNRAGPLNYTTINIPAGVVVRPMDGTRPLDLRATGPVMVAGMIDASGGNGGMVTCATRNGSGGGVSGLPTPGAMNTEACTGGLSLCGGPGGGGGVGTMGGAGAGSVASIGGSGGNRGGGGGGGYSAGSGGGGGGGGVAGGGGAAGAGGGCNSFPGTTGVGGMGGSSGSGAGGAGMNAGEPGRGGTIGTTPSPYNGNDGTQGTACTMGGSYGGGGGGGSIGAAAAADLLLADDTTFQPGSAGGGGGGPAGGGGGGGGGAVRVASHMSVSITGRVLARGGTGGSGDCGGGAGGSGSGGVIFLYAPDVTVADTASISTEGGLQVMQFGGGGGGGRGGVGRIRVTAGLMSCSLGPLFFPPLSGGACAASPTPPPSNQTVVRPYPE